MAIVLRIVPNYSHVIDFIPKMYFLFLIKLAYIVVVFVKKRLVLLLPKDIDKYI